MFTTLQLLHRIARRLKCQGDIAALSGGDRLEVLDAANQGLGEFAGLLPQTRRESPANGTLRAPLTLSLEILNGANGFTYVGGAPFPEAGYLTEADVVGHSITVIGDRRINRLHRPGELLSAYLGTDGQHQATIHGDCIQMGQDERRLLGRPIYSDGTTEWPLIPLDDPHRRWCNYPFCSAETGTPEYYWTEPLLGPERTATPLWLLRVWPLPVVLGTLTYRLESLPAALTLEDFTTARDLPVEDREVPHLVNLCLDPLAGSRLLDDSVTPASLQTAAERSRRAFNDAPQTRDSRRVRIRTRRGW